jgi:hypothetical protein
MIFGLDHHIGERLADKRLATMLLPSILFWGVGLTSAIAFSSMDPEILQRIREFPKCHDKELDHWLVVAALGLLVLLGLSGALIRRLDLVALRLMEGYWYSWFTPRKWLLRYQDCQWDRRENRFQELKGRESAGLTPQESEEFVRLDWLQHWTPSNSNQRMPTRFGNILRSAELMPNDRYGLETFVCWPHLWLLLPVNARSEISEARAKLDSHASIATCGVLLMIWAWLWGPYWWGMVIIALVFVSFAYSAAISAAIAYGSLVVAAFDLYRPLLYSALQLPFPTDPVDEENHGKALTQYLFRGIPRSDWQFVSSNSPATNELHEH